ncbi:unnamed protein product [Durusdinium trenchii]|uniref:N-acetyltransferase domain-containing protein n=1 Tax=Durusdinium trenchii TaxID=1381693 RepID=A0ABP0NHM1_9DINO
MVRLMKKCGALLALPVTIRSCSEDDCQSLQSIEAACFDTEEHAIVDRIEDSRKTAGKGRRGPFFVATFVDVAIVAMDGEELVAGYCAWTCEPFGTSDTCIHVMNLAVAEKFRRSGVASALLKHVEVSMCCPCPSSGSFRQHCGTADVCILWFQ